MLTVLQLTVIKSNSRHGTRASIHPISFENRFEIRPVISKMCVYYTYSHKQTNKQYIEASTNIHTIILPICEHRNSQ